MNIKSLKTTLIVAALLIIALLPGGCAKQQSGNANSAQAESGSGARKA